MPTNPFQRIASWLSSGGARRDEEDARAGRQCPAGHWMDPNWVDCPYCKADRSAQRRGSYQPAPTRVIGSDDPRRPQAGNARRITGVLVTFSWQRQGQLFTLYEGKNLIGSGNAGSGHRPCEVQITTDATLSHEHALIRCLGDDCEIFDQKSENGTYMNDQRVPVHGMSLEDGAQIRTGSTVWRFLCIRAPASPVGKAVDARPDAYVSQETNLAIGDSGTPDRQPDTRATTVAGHEDRSPSEADSRATTIARRHDLTLSESDSRATTIARREESTQPGPESRATTIARREGSTLPGPDSRATTIARSEDSTPPGPDSRATTIARSEDSTPPGPDSRATTIARPDDRALFERNSGRKR